ncbi:MAG: hypothetical protein ACK5LT_01745 [Lachnospirales bacterium]
MIDWSVIMEAIIITSAVSLGGLLLGNLFFLLKDKKAVDETRQNLSKEHYTLGKTLSKEHDGLKETISKEHNGLKETLSKEHDRLEKGLNYLLDTSKKEEMKRLELYNNLNFSQKDIVDNISNLSNFASTMQALVDEKSKLESKNNELFYENEKLKAELKIYKAKEIKEKSGDREIER